VKRMKGFSLIDLMLMASIVVIIVSVSMAGINIMKSRAVADFQKLFRKPMPERSDPASCANAKAAVDAYWSSSKLERGDRERWRNAVNFAEQACGDKWK
jgi:hypothetical protein